MLSSYPFGNALPIGLRMLRHWNNHAHSCPRYPRIYTFDWCTGPLMPMLLSYSFPTPYQLNMIVKCFAFMRTNFIFNLCFNIDLQTHLTFRLTFMPTLSFMPALSFMPCYPSSLRYPRLYIFDWCTGPLTPVLLLYSSYLHFDIVDWFYT
jgi:hypothetical protein